ncbi:hypothetical protein DENSPDRAFT_840443 [Dentipellis sp. KUC8613]|nr:hypothetical protein DENSPDRAFT_840443 [Dentipellis sp. KUC8613]
MSQYAHLSTPDPEILQGLAALPKFEPPKDIASVREQMEMLAARNNELFKHQLPDASLYRVEDHVVPVDGGQIRVQCTIPTAKAREDTTYPLLVYFHSGGWSSGTIAQDERLLRNTCVSKQITTVAVEYRLAPEHPYPTQLNDSFAALKWAAENTAILNVSLSKGFIVAGQSAGGEITGILTHRARDDSFFHDKPLTGQILEVPAIIHPLGYPEQYKDELLSTEQNKDSPFLSREQMTAFLSVYGASPTDVEAWPLLQKSHEGLPPAVLHICGMDPLRDDGILYNKVLKEAGVKTKFHMYPGAPHIFQLVLPQLEISKRYLDDFSTGLQSQ